MKKLLIFILFHLSTQYVFGQACGVYRIQYIGSIALSNRNIVKVFMPTTLLLQGVENEKSDLAYTSTTLTNNTFNLEIGSHLTTPFNDVAQLFTLYKQKCSKFRMKILFVENNYNKESTIDIEWNNIKVSILEDGKIGTLFRFEIKDICN